MKTKTIIIVLIAFVGCIMLAQDAPRGFRNPADVVMMTTRITSGGTGSTLTNGLVAYWGFEAANNITNDVVNTNNLAMVGNVDCTSDGIIGKCGLYTNNLACYFKIANGVSAGININVFTNYTISSWINRSTNRGAVNQGIISKYGSSGNRGTALYFNRTNLSCSISTNGTALITLNTIPVATNEWIHVAITFTNLTCTVYTNGSPSITNTVYAVYNSTASFNVGTMTDADASVFDGMIDDTCIWTNALSPSDITKIYQAGTNAIGYPWTGY